MHIRNEIHWQNKHKFKRKDGKNTSEANGALKEERIAILICDTAYF
jgi:hypothetical protein